LEVHEWHSWVAAVALPYAVQSGSWEMDLELGLDLGLGWELNERSGLLPE
jgi:hypothetical protein